MLVIKDINISYLTDFPASESWLFITPKKIFYITDSRYILEAQEGLKGIIVKQFSKSIDDTLFELAGQNKIKRIGFDERHISHAQYKIFHQKSPKNVQWVAANGLIERLREIKEKNEIGNIKEALRIHKQALQFLKPVIKPGISEREVFYKLENFVKSRNVGFSFAPIIASGPNSCYPHAKITDRKIKNNEPVLVDFGIDYQGYKSDLTRMFFLGKIRPLVLDVEQHVRAAQQKAIQKIRADVKAKEVDHQARNYLKEKRLAKFFGHSLGHGVGLEIHENPRLSQTSTAILKEGMVVTVEPAVYIPHQFGIRIEDMILVKKKDCEVLSVNND